MCRSHPYDLDVNLPLARAVELREKNRLRSVEQQVAVGDTEGDAVSQQAGAQVRGRIAALAVRQARIVVLVLRPVVDDAAHQAREILEERGPELGDQHGARGVQAIGDDEAAMNKTALESLPHLRGDVHGLPVRLARHREGLPQHLQPVPLAQRRGHGAVVSHFASVSALASTAFSFATSTGFGRKAKAPWAVAIKRASRLLCAVSTMTGIVGLVLRTALSSSSPFITGITTSLITAAGSTAAILSRATRPSGAVSTS